MAPSPASVPSTIHRLDAKLINQIAAGEVIVDPASVVKELIENSLDAGATRIEVTVEETTRSVSVRDDGAGMGAQDARLAIERYATSKIETFDDLFRLTTRGFRGEALAAIAAVSRFEMVTRRARDTSGCRVRCEGGENLRLDDAGSPTGTTVLIRDLFYNTPARMKFMRTPLVEWGHILKAFIRQALTRPGLAFSIKWRGRPYLNLPAGQSLKQRLAAVLPGRAGAGIDMLLDADQTVHGMRAWGCISSPKATRRDRRHQYFFANGRPITSRPLTFALQEAYRGLVMTQQFPLAAIFLEIHSEEIDVNVHPTKEQVRFRNEPLAAGAIHRAALEALRGADLVPRFDLPSVPGGKFARKAQPEPATDLRPPSIGKQPLAYAGKKTTPAARTGTPGSHVPASGSMARGTSEATPPEGGSAATGVYPDETAAEEASLIRHLSRSEARPHALAQVAQTYILAESPGVGLLMVDQHAAHEKILYLKYMNQPRGKEVQSLLVPYTYEAGVTGTAVLEALAPALTAEGFETEHFGGGTFVVQSVPVIFEKIDVPAFLRDLVDDVGQGDLGRELDRLRHKIGAMAACRSAVKAGDALSLAEMQGLLDQVLQTAEALRCPHGRPTMILLSKDQLDRQFGRI